ncbi:hypothetical protein TorRG33x02_092870 [Trema orientale]|uniref:Uncharacterized protein n=1 Tax=Trema orientale TaxID=63057 RepID=A0A2P5FBE2_TREOI|nr:hypothetical protein TorRG33x02_092870 [Trema orientale]
MVDHLKETPRLGCFSDSSNNHSSPGVIIMAVEIDDRDLKLVDIVRWRVIVRDSLRRVDEESGDLSHAGVNKAFDSCSCFVELFDFFGSVVA